MLITLCAPQLKWHDSYGRLTGELARRLDDIDNVDVQVWSEPNRVFPDLPADIQKIYRRPYRYNEGGIMLGYPNTYWIYGPMAWSLYSQMAPRLAITMFESTVLPTGWVPALNWCHAVISPSTFVTDMFQANGVSVPVATVPLGVGDEFTYKERRPGKKFKFLAFADGGGRKGWDIAVNAYVRAFGAGAKTEADNAHELIVNTETGLPLNVGDRLQIARVGVEDTGWSGIFIITNRREITNDDGSIYVAIEVRKKGKPGRVTFPTSSLFVINTPDTILVLKSKEGGVNHAIANKGIYVCDKKMNSAELVKFYQVFDAQLALARGEGFGWLSREFARTGGIPIVTEWGGLAEDAPEWSAPIPEEIPSVVIKDGHPNVVMERGYELVPAWPLHEKLKDKCGVWAQANTDIVAGAAMSIRDMPLQERNEWGRTFSNAIDRLYDWDRFAQSVYSVYKRIYSQQKERGWNNKSYEER